MRVLLLEDEADIAEAVAEVLTRDHHHVRRFTHPAELADVDPSSVDAAILDVMIGSDPDAGFKLAVRWREAGFRGPILFTTARDSVQDRIRGLDLGGDDYLVKPYSLGELRARVRALLRRDSPIKQALIERGRLRLDTATRRLWWDEVEILVSAREFALLEYLALHPERVVRGAELADRIFPDATSGGLVARVYIRQLRQKVDANVILTASGGYRLGAE